MKTVFSILFLSLILVSCAKVEVLQENNAQKAQTTYDVINFSLSYENIMMQTQQVMNLLDNMEEKSLRSGKKRKIRNVQVITPDKSYGVQNRNADTEYSTDSLVYLINFEDSKGYALLSGDNRTAPIFLIAQKGNLNIENGDVSDNICPLLENAELLYNRQIEEWNKTYKKPLPEIEDEDWTYNRYGEWITQSEITPMLSVSWGQQAPFNYQLPKIDGKAPATGCVSTAVAQIMSYKKTPSWYDWDAMINDTWGSGMHDVGKLFKDLNNSMSAEYHGTEKTSIQSNKITPCFKLYGFSQTMDIENYNWNFIKADIEKGHPVFIAASALRETHYKKKWIFWKKKYYKYSGSHAWVADGFCIIRRKVETINSKNEIVNTRYETAELLHCNMGWDGIDSGYYNNGIFNTNIGPISRSIEGTKYNYQYNIQMIRNIKK